MDSNPTIITLSVSDEELEIDDAFAIAEQMREACKPILKYLPLKVTVQPRRLKQEEIKEVVDHIIDRVGEDAINEENVARAWGDMTQILTALSEFVPGEKNGEEAE